MTGKNLERQRQTDRHRQTDKRAGGQAGMHGDVQTDDNFEEVSSNVCPI